MTVTQAELVIVENEDGSWDLVEALEPEPEPDLVYVDKIETEEETRRAFVAIDEPEDEPLIGEIVDGGVPHGWLPPIEGAAVPLVMSPSYKVVAPLADVTISKHEPADLSLIEPECRDRRCHEPQAPDSRFCVAHRDVLRRIKDEIAAGNPRKKNRRRGSPASCTTPGCQSPRLPGEDYCSRCQETGTGYSDD